MPVIVSIIFLAFIVAAVGGGGLILALRLQSRLDISAASFSPTVSSLTPYSATGADCFVTEIRWPIMDSFGWSLPVQPDHVELAATEQVQRKAAWARRCRGLICRSLTATSTLGRIARSNASRYRCAGRLWSSSCSLSPHVLQHRLISWPASSPLIGERSVPTWTSPRALLRSAPSTIISLSLEKCCLLDEEATRESTNTAPGLACERCCAESVLECLCGSGALTSSSADGGCLCSNATFHAWSSKRHTAVASLRRKVSVQAVPRRQVIIRHGTGAYANYRIEVLVTMKQHAARNASNATGLSNLSVHLVFNGKPVYDEEDIFESSGL